VEKNNIVVDGAGYTLQGTGNQVTGNGTGIYLGYRYRYNGTYDSRKNVTIKNMQIKYFDHGIWLDAHTSNNTVSGNKITSCIWGIYLLWSSYNTITGNKITNNYRGIQLVKSSNSNGISANNITNNRNGIYLFESSQNTINGNNITNSEIGIVFDGSHDHIYHNNFINNTKQVEDICWTNPWLPSSANILDDGYPSGGNYWSDYEDRYPNATELDDSGIWGTPYVIDANNQDRYPLMKPIVIACAPTISIVSPENKTYTVSNVSLNFTVSKSTSWMGYSLDGQAIATITGNTTLSGLPAGSHSLTVYAKDTAGNTGTSETIYFSLAQQSEPFPTTWIAAAIAIIAIGVAITLGVAVYRRKRLTSSKTP